jgi:hypothetical protein
VPLDALPVAAGRPDPVRQLAPRPLQKLPENLRMMSVGDISNAVIKSIQKGASE